MFSPHRVFKAFTFSMQGFKSAWTTEAAFRDDVILIILAQCFCLYVQPDGGLWLFFIACNALLLSVELLNTGIEHLADHISTDNHKLLGSAKDVGSAAMFLMLVLNVLILMVIVWQRFFAH